LTGVSTALPGFSTEEAIVNESPLTAIEMALVMAVLVLAAVAALALIRGGG